MNENFFFKLFTTVFFFIIIQVSLESQVRADTIYMEDGSIIIAEVIQETTEIITIKFSDNKELVKLNRDDIENKESLNLAISYIAIKYKNIIQKGESYSLENTEGVIINKDKTEIKFPVKDSNNKYILYLSNEFDIKMYEDQKVVVIKAYYIDGDYNLDKIILRKIINTKKLYDKWKNLNRQTDQIIFGKFLLDRSDYAVLSMMKLITKKESEINIFLKGNYLLPTGEFGSEFTNILESGIGVNIGFALNNIFIDNLGVNFEFGFICFQGREEWIGNSYMLPLFLTLSYHFDILPSLTIAPILGGGYSYNLVEYDKDHVVADGVNFTREKAIEPIGMAGLILLYNLSDRYTLHIGADYRLIFESGGTIQFISFNAGAGIRI
jgi:hypothetical protein